MIDNYKININFTPVKEVLDCDWLAYMFGGWSYSRLSICVYCVFKALLKQTFITCINRNYVISHTDVQHCIVNVFNRRSWSDR